MTYKANKYETEVAFAEAEAMLFLRICNKKIMRITVSHLHYTRTLFYMTRVISYKNSLAWHNHMAQLQRTRSMI